MEIQAPTVMNLYPSAATDEEPEESGLVDVVTAENETSLIPERFREMQNTLQQAEDVSEQFQERMEQQQRILEEL
jgi:glutathione synthase/RimK-type ligase-like ATP-grasp enzyme